MAGLYVHIPFCKHACHYCNFHFSTSLQYQSALVNAIATELAMRAPYVNKEKIESIYIGGGTPSLLTQAQLEQLFTSIYQHYNVNGDAEITLEANPDDLTSTTLAMLKQLPINRLSIGVQSFFDEELKWMNRAHNASQAKHCIQDAQDAGFHNLTIDLIYGSPTLTNSKWESNLRKAIDLNINHLSAYCLTVEPKTALAYAIESQKQPALNEEQAEQQFLMLLDILNAEGFEQYEISNFAKNKQYAVHNTNYWKHKIYLGVGPSAHSFNLTSRSWNIANNAKYVAGIAASIPNMETEILTEDNQYNEYVMTALRTIWGIDRTVIEHRFGKPKLQLLDLAAKEFINQAQLLLVDNTYQLTRAGKFKADGIAAALFA